MCPHVLVQHRCRDLRPLCWCLGWQGCSGVSTLLGFLLWCFGGTYRICCRRRNFYPSSSSANHLIQLGLLRSWIVSMICTDKILTRLSVIFQWSVSYMISPDAANMGVKAIYIWAAMLVPTTVLLYLFYPEVGSYFCLKRYSSLLRRSVGHTGKLTSCMSVKYPHGDSRAPRRWPSSRGYIMRRLVTVENPADHM